MSASDEKDDAVATAQPRLKRQRTLDSFFNIRAPPAPTLGALGPALERITRAGWYELSQGCVLGYFPGAVAHLSGLLPAFKALPWEQREVVVMGRRVQQPRRVIHYADGPRQAFTYSGLRLEPHAWAGPVAQVKAAIEGLLQREEAAQAPRSGGGGKDGGAAGGASAGGRGDVGPGGATGPFNSCLLNLYEDGSRYVGWHRDDEKEFGVDPEVVSASFGAARDFQLREFGVTGGKVVSVLLSCGDVCVMRGATQRFWQHCVPKRARVQNARVSLTFRRVVVAAK